MRNYFLVITAILLVTVAGFRLIEESEVIRRLKESLKAYNQNYPGEKVYVQLDKPLYKPGEDIWFNAFVLNSNTNKPSNISDVLYVELIDPKGNIVSRLELVVKEGTAHGDFSLQPSAPGGIYQIRAYTHWMKNFGEESVFRKTLQIQRVITPRLLLKMDYEKEAYGAGELVSAKLTITNLKNEKVSNAPVDLAVKINGKTTLTSQIQSDTQGVASISFHLPGTLSTTDGLLQAIVTAQGVQESISRSIPIVLNKITVQFLPEGGNWVQNTRSRMAFKALDELGKSADVAGIILDEDNNRVTDFQSFHMGMGAFEMQPANDVKYYARIESPPGDHPLIQLPDPMISGFILNLVSRNDTHLRWLVYSPTDTTAHLVAQSHGEIYYGEQIRLKAGENSVKVPTHHFPAGITTFTLFDAGGIEQCERLVSLNLDKGLRIELETSKEQYLPREPVDLVVKTMDHEGKPVPSKISLAVVDDKLLSFADDKQDNLISSLYLSAEVKGPIEEPSFYFDPTEPKATQALDYLLMTQGWRRFTWKDVRENNRPIVYPAEKNKNLSGMLHNALGSGYSGEVTLLELAGKKRVVKVQSTEEGHFLFKNIDPSVPLLLLTKKPGQITLRKESTFSVSFNDKKGTIMLPQEVEVEPTTSLAVESSEMTPGPDPGEGLNVSLDADVSQLSEVVIVGFGTQEQRSIAGNVVSIQDDDIEGMLGASSVENTLQGRIAGVMITPQSGNPGAQSNLMVRGISSLVGGRNEPLYVIDGHPIGTSLNQNFSNGSMVGPGAIRSIKVINSPEATALYGSSAANGAIVITTRSGVGHRYFRSKKKSAKYASLTITPRKFSPTRDFYTPPPSKEQGSIRNDFRTTVYWNHTIVTGKNGEAKLSFYNNDAVSAFRITAEGFSKTGSLGRKEEVYHTQLPLSMDVKLPGYIGYEDVLNLPIRIKNETATNMPVNLTLALPGALSVKGSKVQKIDVKAGSTQTVWYTIIPNGIEGKFPISVRLDSEKYSDHMDHTLHVRPIGFPVRHSFSSTELDKSTQFTIKDIERNSLKAKFTAFPTVLSDLFTGAEAILREPHGCFEQVSSSNFPNILALQYMNQSGTVNPDIEKQATTYIQNGYRKLIAYEIKGGGFEWFGRPPAHEGLTAYGLVQFHEMKKVFAGVDEKMVTRTRDWLLAKRDGKGGFKQSSGKYGFSGASVDVTNAYLIYALSETGTDDILPEYSKAFTEAKKSKDMYRMALLANTAYNLQRWEDYNGLINIFKEHVGLNEFDHLETEHSIVRSYGKSLQVETIGLWTIALMKSPSPDLQFVNRCIRELLSSRTFGQFGSTQATAISLKALAEYATWVRTAREAGEIQVFHNGQLMDRRSYQKDIREKLIMKNFMREDNGKQTLRIKFDGPQEPLPYAVDLQWRTKKPQSNELCKVDLSTSLSASSIKLNESVRLRVSLKNKTDEGLPMTVAAIGIPAGLSVQPWQLKELQEKEVFDFYEISGGNLVLYYRELAPGGHHAVDLDLKAEIPGSYIGGASSAYLYYYNEYKHWVKGNSIVIQ